MKAAIWIARGETARRLAKTLAYLHAQTASDFADECDFRASCLARHAAGTARCAQCPGAVMQPCM